MLKDATKKVVVKQLVEKQNGRFLPSMEDVWKELNKGHYVIGFDVRFSVENGTPKADFSLENVFHIQNNSFQSFIFTAGRRIPPHKIYFHQSFTGNTNLIILMILKTVLVNLRMANPKIWILTNTMSGKKNTAKLKTLSMRLKNA